MNELVLRTAAERGMASVSADQAQQILLQHLEGPAAHARAQAISADQHGATAFDMVHNGHSEHEVQAWLESMAVAHLADARNAIRSPALLRSALRDQASVGRDVERLWRQAIIDELHALPTLPAKEALARQKELARDLEAVLPPRDVANYVGEAPQQIDREAAERIERALNAASGARVQLAAGAHSLPGVKQIEWRMQEAAMSPAQTLLESGNHNFHIWKRNLGYMEDGAMDALRERAFLAVRGRRPLKVLELTHGLPRTALAMTDAGHVRDEGDMLIFFKDKEGKYGPKDATSRHEPPRIESTIVTPHDQLAEYAAGNVPAKARGWFDNELTELFRTHEDGRIKRGVDGHMSLEPIRRGLATARADGRLDVRAGVDLIASLRKLRKEGKRFDLAVTHEVAWTADRVGLLGAIQGALAPGGRAYVPLKWWSPRGLEGDGVNDHRHLADVVELPGGRTEPLAAWLSREHPQAFELRGDDVLVVKGTAHEIALPAMDATPTGAQVRYGLPVLKWKAVPPPAVRPFEGTVLHDLFQFR
jgi:hypothetical protein